MRRALLAAALVLASTPARADESYRKDVIVVDAAAFTVFGAGLLAEARGAHDVAAMGAVGGVLTYLVAAPVVHGAHGRGGRAAASLLLRFAVPMLAGGIAARGDDDLGRVGIGMLVGAAAMSIFDIGVLAARTPDRQGAVVTVARAF